MIQFNFITGLPRSGTTLLASLLRQNPAFYSHIESPTGTMFLAVLESLAARTETGFLASADSRRSALNYMMHGFYEPLVPDPDTFIFDNNRKWANNIPALVQCFPECKVFTLVRPVAEVVESLERSYAENPLHLSVILRGRANLTVYERVKLYLDPEQGVIGWALNALRSGFYGTHGERMNLIRYHDLAGQPHAVLKHIHDAVGAPEYSYDFSKVEQIPDIEWFDRKIGAPGLHELKPQVKVQPVSSALPPDLLHWLHTVKGPGDVR